jgi:hypothetical protein
MFLSSSLIGPELLKILLMVLGPIAVLLGAYLMGKSKANKDRAFEDLSSALKQQEELRKTEKNLNQIEDKRHDAIEAVRSAPSAHSLVELWRRTPWGKTSGSDPDKKAP